VQIRCGLIITKEQQWFEENAERLYGEMCANRTIGCVHFNSYSVRNKMFKEYKGGKEIGISNDERKLIDAVKNIYLWSQL
jgi:predicted transcriptional regulator